MEQMFRLSFEENMGCYHGWSRKHLPSRWIEEQK